MTKLVTSVISLSRRVGLARLILCTSHFVLCTSAASAVCRVKTEAIVTNVVAVPVAVAVGVPVAEAAPYDYSYQAIAPQPMPLGRNDAEIEAIAAKVVEKLRQANPSASAAPVPATSQPKPSQSLAPLTIVAQKCATCHGGAEPKANLSLENVGSLNCETRLKAIRAVLSEKMPKGGPQLTPDEAGRVLEELTRE
jgi:mono/diheme cytochrome c family protein